MKNARLAAIGTAVVLTTALAGCSGGGTPNITQTVTPGPSSSASPIVTSTPTPTATGHFYTLDETWSLSPQSQAQGSGCAPGAGLLPDGIWFGQVTSWSTTEIAFDMECWWKGTGADTQAAAHGDEVNNDYYITNDSTTVRLVSIAGDAFAMKADVLHLDDTSSWVTHTIADVIADPGGTMPVGNPPIVWLAVNGGMVTSLAVQYVP